MLNSLTVYKQFCILRNDNYNCTNVWMLYLQSVQRPHMSNHFSNVRVFFTDNSFFKELSYTSIQMRYRVQR